MKTSFKMLACAFSAMLLLFSCDFAINNNELKAIANSDANTSSSSSVDMSDGEWVCTESIPPSCSFIRPSIKEMPIMDNRVVSYIKMETNPISMEHKFITDRQILKSWFPSAFNDRQTEECDYFALVFHESNYGYTVLVYNDYTESYDQIMIRPGVCSIEIVENCALKCENKYLDDEFKVPNVACQECGKDQKLQMEYHAMLVCDDKIGSLKNKIRFYDTRSFDNPDWDCADGDVKTIGVFF